MNPSNNEYLQKKAKNIINNWIKIEGISSFTKLEEIIEIELECSNVEARNYISEYLGTEVQIKNDNSFVNSENIEIGRGNQKRFHEFSKHTVIHLPKLRKTANLVLSCFVNSQNNFQSIDIPFRIFKENSNIKKSTFNYHVNRLVVKNYLIQKNIGVRNLYCLNDWIFNEYLNRLGEVNQIDKPSKNFLESSKREKSVQNKFVRQNLNTENNKIELNFHHLKILIICEVNDSLLNELEMKKHNFSLKSSEWNFRSYNRQIQFNMNNETFIVTIEIRKNSIFLFFKELETTDIVISLGIIHERILSVLNWIKERFVLIKFPVESDWILTDSTGSNLKMHVEFNNICSDLLESFREVTNISQWWFENSSGGKFGFDSSCRILGKRIPKPEIKSDNVIYLTYNIMNTLRAIANKEIDLFNMEKRIGKLENNKQITNSKLENNKQITNSIVNTLYNELENKNTKEIEALDKIINKNKSIFEKWKSIFTKINTWKLRK